MLSGFEVDVTKVKGVLYRGDNKFEGANHNSPALNDWVNVYPEEMAVVGQIPNKEAHQFMLKAIDLDESIPTAMPVSMETLPTKHLDETASSPEPPHCPCANLDPPSL